MRRRYNKNEGSVKDWISTIIWAGLIAITFRSFLLEPFNIPSGSMIPTLEVGDHLFVKKWSYGYSRYSFPFGSWHMFDGRFFETGEPKRGDVIVFRTPDDTLDYVKRLIGLPGDTIQMRSGHLWINGQRLEREHKGKYVVAVLPQMLRSVGFQRLDNKTGRIMVIKGNQIFEDNKPVDYRFTIEYKNDEICRLRPDECQIQTGDLYIETLPNGVKHEIIKMAESGRYDNTAAFIVPEGKYFFMGDNRDSSEDSRASLGFVSRDNLIGKAWFIFYSHNYYSPLLLVWNWGSKLRWERFGAEVR
ncbi:MAG: signal peptidase I [Rickettsiales bacterium]|jgi:signal peptidase I|nr:signal peptidase I [Rickettsiales bacterium]